MLTIDGVSLFNDVENLQDFAFGKNVLKGYTVKNGQQLDLSRVDQGHCRTFSISFWLRASGNAKIIGTTSAHRKVRVIHCSQVHFGVLVLICDN